MLEDLIRQLNRGASLEDSQTRVAVNQLIEESVPAQSKAQFLGALARKGETTQEIAAFARELREKSIRPPLDASTASDIILDVCGTGGDRLNTFNISTTVAIVAAAANVRVAKHGNRAITSRAGSADVLEALGIPIELSPERAAQDLHELHFAFFFAPKYHPAFKHIAPARKLCADQGQRTIFNFLGPLLNPARPTAQLVGVPHPKLCSPLAQVLQSLGASRGMIVCGHAGQHPDGAPAYLDELSTLGDSSIAEFYQDKGFHTSHLPASQFPIQPVQLTDLAGGDAAANAAIIRNILAGQDRGPKREAVLLNAAAALFVAGKVRTLTDGWDLAAGLIDQGTAQAKLDSLSNVSSSR